MAATGLYVLILLLIVGLLSPYLAPHDPLAVDLANKLQLPSLSYPLGTDHLGRCILSRLIWAIPSSLMMPLGAMLIILCISIPVGLLAGYYGGRIDNLVMSLTNLALSFPAILLAIVIVGLFGPGITPIFIAIISVWWAKHARVVRSMVLSVKQKEFITASRGSGASDWRLMFHHILPNVWPTLIVLGAMDVGSLILSLSGLSFLGLGVQAPTPEWGMMLSDGGNYMQISPGLLLYPGLAILLATLTCNFIGEGLRDAWEVKG